MSRVAALARAGFLTDASYKVGMLVSLAALVATTVPVWLIARAMQPLMADAIDAQGGEYFAFVLVGMVATYFVATACNALPGAVSSGVRSGTLEALLATPAPLPALLAGLAAYPLLWTLLRAVVPLAAGGVFQLSGNAFAAQWVWLAGLVAFRGLWAIYIHSNVRLPIGPLRWIIGAPELHHWHHAKERGSCNFANLSPLMDLMFGTYRCPVCEYVYDESKGAPREGFPAGTAWTSVPDDLIRYRISRQPKRRRGGPF